jgi:putative intracellular protease/amidase
MKFFLSAIVATFLSVSLTWAAKPKKVLIVVTGASELKLKDGSIYKTGYWLEEFTVPFKMFQDKGFDLVVATPTGNRPSVDYASAAVDDKGKPQYWPSMEDLNKALALKKKVLDEGKIISLQKLSDQELKNFDAVFFPGGHGPMADMLNDKSVARVLNHFHKNKKLTALVCHAPAVLVATKGTEFPYKGYKVTAFTDAEENQTPVGVKMSTTPQKELSTAGAIFVEGTPWQSHIVEDRELLTGQNPSSSKAIAEAIIGRLSKN